MNHDQYNNDDLIIVKKASLHNLRDVDAVIPRGSLTVITGPSGSGKSTLAFDTIYVEGQRRYVESMSAYARQFIEQFNKPDVEEITGLSPTISIEQKTTTYNPRSTVGTVTEISDYLRVLYARAAIAKCYNCDRPVQSQSHQQIIDQILELKEGTRLALLAPIIRGRKGSHKRELYELRQKGFVRVRINGEIYDLSDEIDVDKNRKNDIEVYVDRLIIKGDPGLIQSRLSESVELALKMGNGYMNAETQVKDEQGQLKPVDEKLFSQNFACVYCNINYPEPEPRSFSFNSPVGACPECDGLGYEIPDEDEEENSEDETEFIRRQSRPVCEVCEGARLRPESLSYRFREKNIHELGTLTIIDAMGFFKSLQLENRENRIAGQIVLEISKRLEFLTRVGVGYLNINRSAKTLSGGEVQRIRLASQIGSSLVGVVYVLDEPSIGLHPRDHHKLLGTLQDLKNLGNTVIVVEHDQDTIEEADWILDMGPGAGQKGGELVSVGPLEAIQKDPKSLTGSYLVGRKKIEVPKERRKFKNSLAIKGASLNNLKNVDVEIPIGVLTCVTGVSGSGKSSLILDILYNIAYPLTWNEEPPLEELQVQKISGFDSIDKVIEIDQSPIGRTPRSNPSTYTGIFGPIRELFASLPDSKMRGFSPGRFSFNVKGGRCDVCEGDGQRKIEMNFLPNVSVTCEECLGQRYNSDTLSVSYKGKNIAEVMALTVIEALEFFDAVPQIRRKLQVLDDVGLGYIQLGQNCVTLSGGESQRIKLSRELTKRATGQTLYILDEPTTGLHFDDVQKLIKILDRLVATGNTVVVIEHNMDVVKCADYIIDMGPEGGSAGGEVIAHGTPEEICQVKASHTGQYLQRLL